LLLTDPEPVLYQHEPIWSDDRIVGSVTSGAYGHTLGGAVGLGYITLERPVTADALAACRFEVEVEGVRYPARVSLEALYDPGHARERG
jgi:glycine cleavage system aminomethyltransferase T